MDYSPPGSSSPGIFPTRILEWVAISSSKESSQPRDQTHVSCSCYIAGKFFTIEPAKSSFVIWWITINLASFFAFFFFGLKKVFWSKICMALGRNRLLFKIQVQSLYLVPKYQKFVPSLGTNIRRVFSRIFSLLPTQAFKVHPAFDPWENSVYEESKALVVPIPGMWDCSSYSFFLKSLILIIMKMIYQIKTQINPVWTTWCYHV